MSRCNEGGNFRPIAIANLKFKLISKIIVDKLVLVAPKLISQEQVVFVRWRSIVDCIGVTSKSINLLHKMDIRKAFDTLDWDFILHVLDAFGFIEKFCGWIHAILKSACLSSSVNGPLAGFIACSHGVRQGDPLSPLLFYLAEEVLSRGISKLVAEGKIRCFSGPSGFVMPSHTFYADDLMIFFPGSQRFSSKLDAPLLWIWLSLWSMAQPIKMQILSWRPLASPHLFCERCSWLFWKMFLASQLGPFPLHTYGYPCSLASLEKLIFVLLLTRS